MTNRSNIHVRLAAIKFFLRHDYSLRLCVATESVFVLRAPADHNRLQRAAYVTYFLSPCTLAMTSSLTDRGASSYCLNSIEKFARPCVLPRIAVA
jgi:hypothetical protein